MFNVDIGGGVLYSVLAFLILLFHLYIHEGPNKIIGIIKVDLMAGVWDCNRLYRCI